MREIKFRVWDSISKKLYPWRLIKNNPFEDFELEHYTLMQFTGLLDKNGKEIYEGDLVKYYESSLVVKFGKIKGVNGFGLGFADEHTMSCLLTENHEVIGNIHENKDF